MTSIDDIQEVEWRAIVADLGDLYDLPSLRHYGTTPIFCQGFKLNDQ
jgi:hypothetical protein